MPRTSAGKESRAGQQDENLTHLPDEAVGELGLERSLGLGIRGGSPRNDSL